MADEIVNVTGTGTVPAETLTIPEQDITIVIPAVTLTVKIPAQSVAISASSIPVTVPIDETTLAAAIQKIVSPSGTQITAGALGEIVDSAGNIWSLVDSATLGYQVAVNGKVDASTANVKILGYANGLIAQENTGGYIWTKTSPTAPWVPATALP